MYGNNNYCRILYYFKLISKNITCIIYFPCTKNSKVIQNGMIATKSNIRSFHYYLIRVFESEFRANIMLLMVAGFKFDRRTSSIRPVVLNARSEEADVAVLHDIRRKSLNKLGNIIRWSFHQLRRSKTFISVI